MKVLSVAALSGLLSEIREVTFRCDIAGATMGQGTNSQLNRHSLQSAEFIQRWMLSSPFKVLNCFSEQYGDQTTGTSGAF